MSKFPEVTVDERLLRLFLQPSENIVRMFDPKQIGKPEYEAFVKRNLEEMRGKLWLKPLSHRIIIRGEETWINYDILGEDGVRQMRFLLNERVHEAARIASEM